jgi:hypothetical protein
MGKQRRKAERKERRRLKVLEGGREPNAVPGPSQKSVPLEGRPEHTAHMAAWRAAGCPRPE